MFSFPADSNNLQYLGQVSFFGQEQLDLEGGYDHLLMGSIPPIVSSNRPNSNPSPPYDDQDLQFLSNHLQQQRRPGGCQGEPTAFPPAASCSFTSTSPPVVGVPQIDLPTRPEHKPGGEKGGYGIQPAVHLTAPEIAPAVSSVRKRVLRKDRHSKIVTAKGPRDRRMRLSLDVAKRFFQLQDELGFDKPSKTVDWLLTMSKDAIAATAGECEDIYCAYSQAAVTKSSTSDSEIDSVSNDNDTTNNHHDKGKTVMGDEATAVLQASLRAVNIAGETTEGAGYGDSAPADKVTRRTRATSSSTSNVLIPRSLTRRQVSDPTAAKESREKARARARERTIEKKLRTQCMQPPAGHHYNETIISNGIDVHEIRSPLGMAAAEMQGGRYYCTALPSTSPPVATQLVADGSAFLQHHSSSGYGEMISVCDNNIHTTSANSYCIGCQVLGSIFQDQSNFLHSSSLSTAAFGAQSGITDHAHFLPSPWDGLNNP